MKPYKGDGSPVKDSINVLDCALCEGAAWFPTFERLARHMKEYHDPHPENATALLHSARELKRWKRHEQRKEYFSMKNTPARKNRKRKPLERPTRRSAGLPEPSGDAPSSFQPFLKAEHIGKKVGSIGSLKIKPNSEPRMVDGNFGEQIVLPVILNGKQYDWAITVDSVNHRILFDRFGANPANWRGTLRVETKMSRQNRLYVALV